jgi:hypothetical protein
VNAAKKSRNADRSDGNVVQALEMPTCFSVAGVLTHSAPTLGREDAFAEVESGHSAAFLGNGRCAVHS